MSRSSLASIVVFAVALSAPGGASAQHGRALPDTWRDAMTTTDILPGAWPRRGLVAARRLLACAGTRDARSLAAYEPADGASADDILCITR